MADNNHLRIFYSHSIYKYNTSIEEMELKLIKKAFPLAEIINPNTDIEGNGNRPESEIMVDCVNAVKNCDILVFSTISGVIGAGVLEEIQTAFLSDKLVYEIADYTLYNIDDYDCTLLDTDTRREYAIIRTKRCKSILNNDGYKFMPDGEHECDTRVYNHRQMFENVTVEILEDDNGNQSIGWYRQENTNELEEFGE